MQTNVALPSVEPTERKRLHGGRRLRAIVAVPLLLVQALFLVLAASTNPAHAVTTGSVSGVVRTLAGEPVPKAVVTFARAGGGFTTVTAADGSYSRNGLPVDDYTIEVKENCFDDFAAPITVDGAEVRNVVLGFEHDTFGHVCHRSVLGTFAANVPLSLSGDDAVQAIQLGFPFPFYGGLKTQAFISTNGFLTFTAPPSGIHATNLPLLDPDTPPDGIFPFWDDLIVDQNAQVRTIVTGSAPNRVENIEWHNVAFLSDPSQRLTFRVSLFEDGRILMNWQTGTSARQQGSSATVGLRNGNPGQPFDALELSESQPRITLPGSENLEFSTNHAPVADAGANKTVGSGAGFTIDGSGTTDPDGTSGLVFEWTQTAGPATVIQDRSKAKTTVTGVKGPATLTYQLRVIDPFGRASFDSATVTVSKPK